MSDGKDKQITQLKGQIAELEGRLENLTENNRKLQENLIRTQVTLLETKNIIQALHHELNKLSEPPQGFGYFRRKAKDEKVVVRYAGHDKAVAVSPALEMEKVCQVGIKLVLNEALAVIDIAEEPWEEYGEEVKIIGFLENGWLRVQTRFEDTRDVCPAAILKNEKLKEGDVLQVYDIFAIHKRPKSQELEHLSLEKIPEETFEHIGGLKEQIETLLEAIEYPALYPEHFASHKLKPTKGILLYGPPGCGKTLIAKAVANRLAQRLREKTGDANLTAYFINVKGPELLNKYVGETERKIREIFQRAKEKATEGSPVIIFFDEFESLFRIRGAGISSDMESTIVPQFLAEMDGVETLNNVIVIGASNRQDLIDPAVLRPGRFDLKIKIDRPDKYGAREIFEIYVTPDLPWGNDSDGKPYVGQKEHSVVDRLRENKIYIVDLSTPELMAKHAINVVVDYLYYVGPPISWTDRRNNKHEYNTECVELTWADGEKKKLHIKDILVSGAMIESIATRVKKAALKRLVKTDEKGIKIVDYYTAIRDEIKENSDLPNTNNPDDWAKIIGQHSESGSRLVNVRFIGTQKVVRSRRVEEVRTGHYL